ncbi:glycoside hydrolase family 97 protein [Longitalea luteola]|uniref:glycoside hydrolase family 97 protein n=1 Tax=Longitalea luteola TaxID=2812563 RepID=UPI001A9796B4|nr:glycoside hydrolase family 97 protein [Longitalea luteola]
MRLLLTICFLLLCSVLFAADSLLLQSPNRQLAVTVSLNNGKLMYALKAGTKMLLSPAPLGIQLQTRTIGMNGKRLALHRRYTVNETRSSRLNNSRAVNHYNGYCITVQQNDITDTIEFRLFDQGCAFRYLPVIPASTKVQQELTSFTLPAHAGVWYFERNSDWKLKSYAGLWMRTDVSQLPAVSGQGPIQGKPLVITLPSDKYMVLTEAALHDYSGMRLKAVGNNTLQVNFTEAAAGFPVSPGSRTPWRVILYATGLNELVNNTVIENLNPLPDRALFADKAYIKPGKAVWSWITRNEHYLDPAEEKQFIDAANALHFDYTLIDDGWETIWKNKWQTLQQLCDYARKKQVGVWVWKHSKEILDPQQRDRFLDSIRLAGAVGLKTDFMNSEARSLIDFEIGLLKAAAQRKLMVVFHGCQAPTGESVTYPNEMSREGIRGMELNIMNEPIPAWHNAALPFTRFLCGHGDYTPGFFTKRAQTTNTHQLALLYLFNSPFQCLAENPGTLLHDPIYAPILPLLRTLPVTWDETRVLPGSSIGALAAFARRKGKDWYVAVINGTDSAITYTLQPSFLPKKKKWKARVVTDAAGDTGFESVDMLLQATQQKQFPLQAAGGLVIHIKND